MKSDDHQGIADSGLQPQTPAVGRQTHAARCSATAIHHDEEPSNASVEGKEKNMRAAIYGKAFIKRFVS